MLVLICEHKTQKRCHIFFVSTSVVLRVQYGAITKVEFTWYATIIYGVGDMMRTEPSTDQFPSFGYPRPTHKIEMYGVVIQTERISREKSIRSIMVRILARKQLGILSRNTSTL